jgi:regulator of cell morphogenesis and NO signaling
MLNELERHMMREQQVLFQTPLAEGGGCAPFAMRQMRLEHDDHQVHLSKLEALTHGFTPPPDACGSRRAFYRGYEKLDLHLRHHIEIENGVLLALFE